MVNDITKMTGQAGQQWTMFRRRRQIEEHRGPRALCDLPYPTARSWRLGTTGSRTTHTSFPWKVIIICAVIAMFIGAFLYNHFHVSSEEKAITDYMNAQQANAADENEVEATYLMSDSAERYLEASDIEHYSRDEVQLMINEIYARHGREFHSQENMEYFSARDWYKPVSGKSDEEIVSEFNECEKANVELLSQYL